MNKQKVHIHLVFNPFSSWVIYMKNLNEKQRLKTLKLFKRIHIQLLYAFILNRSYSINVQSIAVTHKALFFPPNTVIPKCALFAGTVIWLWILVKDKILYFYFKLQTFLTKRKKKKKKLWNASKLQRPFIKTKPWIPLDYCLNIVTTIH